MIDPLDLANDILGTVALLALPVALWALLYLVAWEHGPFAESLGLGRRTFWLLVPGALLATLVLLPIAPISNDWLSISFAGALFPLLVVGLVLARIAPPGRRGIPTFVLCLVVETAVLLLVVIAIRAPVPQLLAVVGVAAAVPTVVALVSIGRTEVGLGRISVLLGLASGVTVVTFASSMAIPGVGIEEGFPAYLLGPIMVGLIAVAIAGPAFRGFEALALPSAYLAATVGVLVGADVLRQPPLYGSGPAGLYAIGGAGIFDLVYLSGLLAFGSAYVAHRLVGRDHVLAGPAPEVAPTPVGRLAGAYRAGVGGEIPMAIAGSAAAGREAAAQAHHLLGLPEASPDRPWQGLPVPGWVVSDQANLDSAARWGPSDGKEGFRAYLTARWLVLIGRELGLRRFGSVNARIAAFGIDLAAVTAPAVALWAALVLAIPGSLDTVAANIGFNAAIYGYAALAFLYFALTETLGGATVGKRLLGLSVRDRHLARPTFLSSLVRNASKLPTLTLVGLGLAVGVLVLLKSGGATLALLGGIPLSAGFFEFLAIFGFVLGGVGLLGLIAVALIAVTPERQRFGDLVAGTWVVRAATPVLAVRAPPSPTPTVPTAPAVPPPG